MDMKTIRRENNMARKIALGIALCCLLFACSRPAPALQTDAAPAPVAPALKIGPGDLVEVTMFENPDLSGRYRVDQNGDVEIALIGHVHVAGLTADQAGRVIEKRFVQEQILQPAGAHATVFIAEYASQGISVSGEVKTPGVYPALGIRKLQDLIIAAGGVTVAAASKAIVTRKDDPAHPLTVDYNPEALKPVIPDLQIFPGDSILIPRAGIVYVLGNVQRSGGFVLDGRDQMTIEKALALAGGTNHSTSMNQVQLVRTLNDGRKEAVTIPLGQILKGKAPDVAMKDGDILFIPTSNLKLVGVQAAVAAAALGTAVLLYRATY